MALTVRLLRAAPGPTVGLVLTETARSATAAWQAVLAGSLVGALSSGGGWGAPLLLLGATVLALPALQQLSRVLTTMAEGGLLLALRRDVAVGSLSAPTLDHLDDEVAMRRLRSTVRDVDSWVVRESVDMLRSLLGARLAGIAFFVVAARWNLLVATSVAICAWWLGRASRPFVTSVLGGWQDEGHGDEDRAHYLTRLAVDPLSAPEVRVFGWSGWLDESARALRRRARESSASARARSMRPLGRAFLLSLVVMGLGVRALVLDGLSGGIPPGDVVTVTLALVGIAASLGPQGDPEYFVRKAAAVVAEAQRLPQVLAGDRPVVADRPRSAADRPVPRGEGVRLVDVTYTYPGASAPALDHVTVLLPPGQRVALVGANGAGKSTALSLVAGLRRPSTGQIVGLPPAPGTDLVAAVWQDPPRYRLTVRENLTLGLAAEDSQLRDVLRGVGLDAHVAGLPRGLDTVLEPGEAEGVDLSGGQWQRLALARALLRVRRGAQVLLLDEPTSALDAHAELGVFATVLQEAGAATIVLVSHRMAAVHQMDRVLVLEHGRIVEDGHPHELLAEGGRYAEMFRTQAARYASQDRTTEVSRA
ncbi:ATP-binding cassette domain-containing protein [Arsenicicoccus dermatophilus]|uniref:ATP-binding cassette domain-containing protein n=1 Tax=Arsenicicoccus dermatophilus TaxID=1076331 RepID=UPI003916F1DD